MAEARPAFPRLTCMGSLLHDYAAVGGIVLAALALAAAMLGINAFMRPRGPAR